MHIEPQTKSKISSHANRLAGQIKSISTMLKDNRNASEMLKVILAVEASFISLTSRLNNAYRMHINIILHTPLPSGLQSSESIQLIDSFKITLCDCSLKDLYKILKSLHEKKIISS